jgi:hypothetical protein
MAFSLLTTNSLFPVVDTVRVSLESKALHLFWGVLISCAIVAVGCILELPESVESFKHWREKRKTLQATPEDLTNWNVPMGLAGVILVCAGVIGEGVFEGLQDTAETAVRAHDDAILGTAVSNAAEANTRAASLEVEAACARERTAQLETTTERLKTEAEDAKRDTVKAQRDLAILNGPPYRIHVSADGVAIPDLSKSNQQTVILTQNTQIRLPTFPKNGSHLLWTLSIYQNSVGGHHFTFSPDIGGFDPNVNVFPNTGWLVTLQTDSGGTQRTSLGGIAITSPTISK